nr:MAG TPA: hypothetical protein [Caudoviricetes sp.]
MQRFNIEQFPQIAHFLHVALNTELWYNIKGR